MTSASPPDGQADFEYDPTFLNSRKEAWIIFSVWAAGLIWAVPFCYLNGYVGNIDPENIATIFGIPSWLFWGIAVPWLVADLFTVWFCFFYMSDDDLGEAREGADIEEEVAEVHAAQAETEQGGQA